MLATCCHHAFNVLSNNPAVLIRGVVPLTAVRHLGFHNPGGWLPAGLKVADLSRNTLPPLLALATAVRPGQLGSWGPQVDAIPVAVHRHSGTAAKTWPEETRNALNQALTLSHALHDLVGGFKLAKCHFAGNFHPRWRRWAS